MDKIKICPYILDPEFIASTHVYLQIVNQSKSDRLIGYSVISLFNVFPTSLVDRDKLRTRYNRNLFAEDEFDENGDLNINGASTQNDKNDFYRRKRRRKLNDKEFNSPITIYGTYIGDIKGFIHAQSELVDKHRKISMKQKYK